jgi:simple sugar transport system permease protein
VTTASASMTAGRSLRRIVGRREATVTLATGVAFAFFAVTAGGSGFLTLVGMGNYLYAAAQIGIIAAPITLLMIAGEFDLSVGSMVGAAEVAIAYGVVDLRWTLAESLGLALALAVVVGTVNAVLVVKAGLPSFIVTLAALFVLLGLAQGFALTVMGDTTITDIEQPLKGEVLVPFFEGSFHDIPAACFWWLGITLAAAWLLAKRTSGNWIFALGGNLEAARRSGVPVLKAKILLFVSTSAACVIVGCLDIFQVNEADANDGTNLVFEVVTAAVIGGTLLTGGLGTPIGTAVASLLFGIVSQGFFFTNIPEVWYEAFVGFMLLGAVLVSKYSGNMTRRRRAIT